MPVLPICRRVQLTLRDRRIHPYETASAVLSDICIRFVRGVLTFLGCDSSSTGYHFWAFWDGTSLWAFPNCFVVPTSDILAADDEEDLKRK